MPTHTDIIPSPGSLPARVLLWLSSNPDEELYTNDIAIKFEAPPAAIASTLRRSVDVGWLRRTGSGKSGLGGGYTYGITDSGQEAAQRIRAISRPSESTDIKRNPQLPPLDAAAMTVEYDVVPRPFIAPKGRTRYDDLLDRLDRPGASVLVPHSYHGTLTKAAQTYGKRTGRAFRVVRETLDQSRLIRVENPATSTS